MSISFRAWTKNESAKPQDFRYAAAGPLSTAPVRRNTQDRTRLGPTERLRIPAERPLHILVVDDNPINQCVATSMLERLGHTWVTAANGQEALLALACEAFDVVLMDIQMPEMDGLEATRRIRAQEQNCGGHRSIIAVTANAIAGDRERFLKGGMDAYVAKPVRMNELASAIDDVLRGR